MSTPKYFSVNYSGSKRNKVIDGTFCDDPEFGKYSHEPTEVKKMEKEWVKKVERDNTDVLNWVKSDFLNSSTQISFIRRSTIINRSDFSIFLLRQEDFNAANFSLDLSAFNPLSNYNDIVKSAKSMLNFKIDWDGDGGLPIDPILFDKSTKLIGNYIEGVYKELQQVIPSPSINPMGDGTIDFEWSLKGARLLINLKYENKSFTGSFYGDLNDNVLAIKGTLPSDKVYEHLLKWMKNLA